MKELGVNFRCVGFGLERFQKIKYYKKNFLLP